MSGVPDRFVSLPLQPHSMAPVTIHGIEVSGALAGRRLTLRYQLHGDLARLRIPPHSPAPQRCDGLWQHTCFELFARYGDDAGYREFNFSPSGDWAAYEFGSYRGGSHPLAEAAVTVTSEVLAHQQLMLRAEVELRATGAHPWQLNLTAVVEDRDGQLSYWALHHPRAQPDFHDAGGFRLQLAGTP